MWPSAGAAASQCGHLQHQVQEFLAFSVERGRMAWLYTGGRERDERCSYYLRGPGRPTIYAVKQQRISAVAYKEIRGKIRKTRENGGEQNCISNRSMERLHERKGKYKLREH